MAKFEASGRGGGGWLPCSEERVRGMLRRQYGDDREAWAMGQVLRGREVETMEGTVRLAEDGDE